MINVHSIDNLILKYYFADILTGCSNPIQGEMNLHFVHWMKLYFVRYLRAQCTVKLVLVSVSAHPDRAPMQFMQCSSWPHPSVSCTWQSNCWAAHIPTVLIEAGVLQYRAYAQQFIKDQLHDSVGSL